MVVISYAYHNLIHSYCNSIQFGYNKVKGNQFGYKYMHYIKELRESTNLSQKEFADMFHIPVSTLRKWEQNESTPPVYVVNLITNSLPQLNKNYEEYYGTGENKFYLDRENNRVGDSLGNWISFHEDISNVIEENIGIYIENLFSKYYEIVKNFDNELKYDKIHKIKWR